MTDSNEEIRKLKEKVEELEKKLNKLDDLEKKLDENTKKDKERDNKHHEELKALTEKNHKENLTWNKAGAILIPLTVAIVPLILRWFDSKQDIKPAIKKDADNINDKLSEVLKAIRESKNKE